MSKLGTVEDTLFVPLLGRIYASKNFPALLYDEKALELEKSIPSSVIDGDKQKQYTLIASASRSKNMDRYIDGFLALNPNGNIVELGCGLETTLYRHKEHKGKWYLLDLPNVIEYRKSLLGEEETIYLPYSVFAEEWERETEKGATLFIASGLFYYFSYEDVLIILKKIHSLGGEIVFDAVNQSGMKMMSRKYMKEVGHGEAKVYFYVDNLNALKKETGFAGGEEEPYYRLIPKKGLKLGTRLNMNISDKLKMVKMIHLFD